MPELTPVQFPDIRPPEGKDLHWLVTGYVSPGARAWIEELGGHVIQLSSTPSFIAVGLAYDPKGAWVWSHGRREHREGIEFWSSGEIQEASTSINLLCPRNAEYRSCETNYLILPDEEFDEATGRVKEPSQHIPMPKEAVVLPYGDDSLGNLDDHPF
jgi:hypothetical protein